MGRRESRPERMERLTRWNLYVQLPGMILATATIAWFVGSLFMTLVGSLGRGDAVTPTLATPTPMFLASHYEGAPQPSPAPRPQPSPPPVAVPAGPTPELATLRVDAGGQQGWSVPVVLDTCKAAKPGAPYLLAWRSDAEDTWPEGEMRAAPGSDCRFTWSAFVVSRGDRDAEIHLQAVDVGPNPREQWRDAAAQNGGVIPPFRRPHLQDGVKPISEVLSVRVSAPATSVAVPSAGPAKPVSK